jgi:DNA-binding NarL/FixJ family response regulator
MAEHFRILLLEPNRYRAFLMQKALSGRSDKAIVVTFREPAQAVAELRTNEYAVVVIDVDLMEGDRSELLQAMQAVNPRLRLTLLRSPQTPRFLVDAFGERTRCVWAGVDDAPDDIAALINVPASQSDNSPRIWPGVRSPHRSRLAPAGQ